jgi:hypothetical protein
MQPGASYMMERPIGSLTDGNVVRRPSSVVGSYGTTGENDVKRIIGVLGVVVAMCGVPALAFADGVDKPLSAAPTVENARVGIAPAAAAAEPPATAPAMQVRAGQSVALMAVGGAALVLGLIIGDSAGTVLAVGGAIIGLLGLYQFVR